MAKGSSDKAESKTHSTTKKRQDEAEWDVLALLQSLPPYVAYPIADSIASAGTTQIKPQDVVFHYTSAESFEKILRAGKIWLTNAACVNDHHELSYPVRIARDVLGEIAVGEDEPTKSLLHELAEGLDAHSGLFGEYYIGSFSLEGNLLSQWRAYCPDGGYSLGLDPEKLARILSRRKDELLFGPVIYDKSEQRSIIKNFIVERLHYGQKLRAQFPDVDEVRYQKAIIDSISIGVGSTFQFIKMPAFREEREWRIVHAGPGRSALKFRVRNGILTPYVEVDLTQRRKLPLETVFISPLVDADLARYSAVALLEHLGYPEANKLLKPPGYKLRF